MVGLAGMFRKTLTACLGKSSWGWPRSSINLAVPANREVAITLTHTRDTLAGLPWKAWRMAGSAPGGGHRSVGTWLPLPGRCWAKRH